MIRIIDHEGNGYGAQAEITRKKGVNGEKSLTGVIYTNEEVLHGVDRGWKLEFENEIYAFTFALPKDTGNRIELDFDAVHEFFFDMSKDSQNDLLNDGSHTFKAYLDFIFGDTPYNYSLEVDVSAFEKETFGQRNRLDLFYDIIDTAGVEFSVNGSTVRIIERVGNDLSTVVKKGFNLNDLQLEKNIGDFVTYQKGFGAWFDEEDHSKGRLEVEYLSPLADIYGKLDADPVVDERYAVRNNLLARLQSNVEGSYQISVQIDMEDLTRAGYEYKQPHEGDSIMAINDDLGFQRKVRIVSYETDFDIEGNILDHRITCNSIGMVEQSISSTNGIKYAINELQNDLELARNQITEARLSADGKSMNYYGPVEPTEDDYKLSIGDTWFDTSGENTVIKAWNGVEWRNAGLDSKALQRQFDEVKREIQSEKERIDDVVQQIDVDITDKFTSLDETISDVQSISNAAQANAEIARDHALDALGDADTAMTDAKSALNGIDQLESTVSDINFDIDEINGTLDLKADSQTVDALDGTVTDLSTDVSIIAGELSAKADSSVVDTLSGIVDNHTLDIQANAEGLALKANQDTVDTLAGTVQSLGTEFDIVAGQVNSRVWNTDIETAIDGIEVGGRNLLTNSTFRGGRNGWSTQAGDVEYVDDLMISSGSPAEVYRTNVLNGLDTATVSVWVKGNGRFQARAGGGARVGYTVFNHSTFKQVSSTFDDMGNGNLILMLDGDNIEVVKVKLEKGNKATDWTPAPEDTDAKISHIETEWTQTFDSFSQTVAGIDGRVTAQSQTIDSIKSTVADAEGRISMSEQNIHGLQDTVSDPVNGLVTQVSTLASGFNVLARDLENMEVGGRNLLPLSNGNLKAYAPYNSSWFVEGTLIATSINSSANTLNLSLHEDNLSETLSEGEVHTISGFIRVNGQIPAKNIFINNRVDTHLAVEDVLSFRYNPDTGFFVTTVPKARNSWIIYARTELVLGDVLTIDKMKIEKGTIATDWTPAPEDMATQAQFSVLNNNINMRVSKGELMSQINIEAGRTLIQSNKLYLDAETVAFSGNAFIPGAYIENASIDNAKIANATITSGKIANLNVNKLSGNRSEFVQSHWNSAAGGNVRINGTGILTTADDGSQTYIQNGIVGARNPGGSSLGHIGYHRETDKTFFHIQTTLGANFAISAMLDSSGNTKRRTMLDIFPGSSETYIRTNDFRHIGATGDSSTPFARFYGDVNIDKELRMSGANIVNPYGVYFDNGGSSIYSTTSHYFRLDTSSSGIIQFRVGRDQKFRIDSTRNYSSQRLNMQGNSIVESPSVSDARMKDIYGIRTDNDLEKLMKIEYVDFKWKDPEFGGEDLGFIAQQVQSIVPEIITEAAGGMLGYNQQTYLNFVGHAVQQLALRELNTNKVASEALILAEDTSVTALNNKSEIETLKEELSKANQRIEVQQKEIQELKRMVA